MGLTHTANIRLAVKVKGKEKLVPKGEALPAGVDDAVVAALLGSGLVTVSGDEAPVAAAGPVTPPTGLPAERDTREVWKAYAAVVGLDPADYANDKKPALVATVTAAHEAKLKADADEKAKVDADGSGSGD